MTNDNRQRIEVKDEAPAPISKIQVIKDAVSLATNIFYGVIVCTFACSIIGYGILKYKEIDKQECVYAKSSKNSYDERNYMPRSMTMTDEERALEAESSRVGNALRRIKHYYNLYNRSAYQSPEVMDRLKRDKEYVERMYEKYKSDPKKYKHLAWIFNNPLTY